MGHFSDHGSRDPNAWKYDRREERGAAWREEPDPTTPERALSSDERIDYAAETAAKAALSTARAVAGKGSYPKSILECAILLLDNNLEEDARTRITDAIRRRLT